MLYTFQATYLKVLAWDKKLPVEYRWWFLLRANHMEINDTLIVHFSQKNIISNRNTTTMKRENFPYAENSYNKWKARKNECASISPGILTKRIAFSFYNIFLYFV
jgi:hypothetical protein